MTLQGALGCAKIQRTITLEFPHLMRLIENAQFDTVYHEHFSYLSLCTVERIFKAAGLRIFDVEELQPMAAACVSMVVMSVTCGGRRLPSRLCSRPKRDEACSPSQCTGNSKPRPTVSKMTFSFS